MDGRLVRVPVATGLHLSLHDAGSGATVVLLHGIPGSGASWQQVAGRLHGAHRVLVPDLLGFGGSSRSAEPDALHAASQAGLLLRALDELGIDRYVLIGHDFGGVVALAGYLRAPQRVAGLGLLATNAFSDTPIPFPLNTVAWPLVGKLAASWLLSSPALRMMVRRGVGRPGVRLSPEDYVGDPAQARAIATIFAHSLRNLSSLYQPYAAALAEVAVPSFVAWGDHDPFFTVHQGRRTAATLAGSAFHLLEGAGHFLPEERPEAVAACIARLMARARNPVAVH